MSRSATRWVLALLVLVGLWWSRGRWGWSASSAWSLPPPPPGTARLEPEVKTSGFTVSAGGTPDEGEIQIRFDVVNVGRSPAYDVRFSVGYHPRIAERVRWVDNPSPLSRLEPGQHATVPVVVRFDARGADKAQIASWEPPVHLAGIAWSQEPPAQSR